MQPTARLESRYNTRLAGRWGTPRDPVSVRLPHLNDSTLARHQLRVVPFFLKDPDRFQFGPIARTLYSVLEINERVPQPGWLIHHRQAPDQWRLVKSSGDSVCNQ
jgi:hypothetical protein